MSGRHSVDRIPRFKSLIVSFVLYFAAVSCPAVSDGAHQQTDSFLAQGKICLYVDVQKEFDKTVKAVKEVLSLADTVDQEAKLNHTIYKGLLNHVIRQSVYLNDIQNGLPKADEEVVEKLEEAGFVVLANLAKKDYTFSVNSQVSSRQVPTQLSPGSESSSQIATSQPQGGEQDQADDGSRKEVTSFHIQAHHEQGSTQVAEEDQTKTSSDSGQKTSGKTASRTNTPSPCDVHSPHIEVKKHCGISSKRHCLSSSSGHQAKGEGIEEIDEPSSLDPSEEKPKIDTTQRSTPNHPTSEDYLNVDSDANEIERRQRGQPPIPTSGNQQGSTVQSPEASPPHGQGNHGNDGDDIRLVNKESAPIVEDDLYWSDAVEAATPRGFSQHELDEWKHRLSTQKIHSIEPGGLTKCGRDKNRFIVLDDGSKLCVRYRYPLITSMTGELYSYHLARILGLTNLPPLHVAIATTNNSMWLGQGSSFQQAGWEDGKAVLLTKWIEDLDEAFLPETLVQGPFPVGAMNSGLQNLTTRELASLVQWSDLLLFDYLIAHFDRLTINLSSVRHYNDTSLMRSQVHNLVQHPHTKQLWIVDNESGLLDGYSFLMASRNKDGVMHSELHEELLQKVCIFRRSTIRQVRALFNHPNPAKLLSDRVRREDPAAEGVFPALDQIHGHSKVLKERLGRIDRWTQECRRKNAADKHKILSKP